MKSYLFFLGILYLVRSQTVCSQEELMKELKEDILENGKLDCLINTIGYFFNVVQKMKMKTLRANDWPLSGAETVLSKPKMKGTPTGKTICHKFLVSHNSLMPAEKKELPLIPKTKLICV